MGNRQHDITQCWIKTIEDIHQLGLKHSNTQIRISFAYLFRIKIGEKYMLVQSERKSNIYKPIGGTYQYFPREIKYLSDHFDVRNDNGDIPDVFTPGDYRLLVPGMHLQSFLYRFDYTSDRESITDLSRELIEEITYANASSLSPLRYRYCGRHISKINYSAEFQRYNLFLADIVELLLNQEQYNTLEQCNNPSSERFLFATSNEIMSSYLIGNRFVNNPIIAEHSYKILPENEALLFIDPSNSGIYEVSTKKFS